MCFLMAFTYHDAATGSCMLWKLNISILSLPSMGPVWSSSIIKWKYDLYAILATKMGAIVGGQVCNFVQAWNNSSQSHMVIHFRHQLNFPNWMPYSNIYHLTCILYHVTQCTDQALILVISHWWLYVNVPRMKNTSSYFVSSHALNPTLFTWLLRNTIVSLQTHKP